MNHADAVYRAGRNAKFATGAFFLYDRVGVSIGADDRVDWACGNTQCATNTVSFFDNRNGPWVSAGERPCSFAQKFGKCLLRGFSPRWAKVDVFIGIHKRFGIGTAAWIPALCALGLRQQGIYSVDRGYFIRRIAFAAINQNGTDYGGKKDDQCRGYRHN